MSCDPKIGKCYISYLGLKQPKTSNYMVLDTDYENYSIVYHCRRLTQEQIVQILSRQPEMNRPKFNQILEILK